MGVLVFGIGVVGGALASLVLTCYPEKMVSAAYAIAVSAILTLAYFFAAARHADKSQLLVACGILGFLLLPILMVAYEIAVA